MMVIAMVGHGKRVHVSADKHLVRQESCPMLEVMVDAVLGAAAGRRSEPRGRQSRRRTNVTRANLCNETSIRGNVCVEGMGIVLRGHLTRSCAGR